MKFGVPSQRAKRKVELFPTTPVLTIGVDGGKGTSRVMTLNETAVTMLGLGENAVVAFGFEEAQVFISNGGQEGIPEEHQIRVTKGNPRKISEKRTYTYLSEKIFDLDNSIDNHLELKEVVEDGVAFKSFELVLIAKESTEPDGEVIEAKEEEVTFEEEKVMSSEEFSPSTTEEVISAINGGE